MNESGAGLRVCVAGTWDPTFHRNRTLRRLLDLAGYDVSECRVELWGHQRESLVEKGKLKLLGRAVTVYPKLIWRFMRTPKPDLVLIPYPGHVDAALLTPLARMRGVPVVFDIFISLFDTVVSDRRLVSKDTALGRLLLAVDGLACRIVDMVMADTPAHADFLARLAGAPRDRFRVLWLGAQEDVFKPQPHVEPQPRQVAFHGTFIRLQGLDTIVRAAKLLEKDEISVELIGDGQERDVVDRLISRLSPSNVVRTGMIPLGEVPRAIASASVCLGIFGTSDKADRVIPNKLYECLAVGRPVITGDTSAIRDGFDRGEVVGVPVADPQALAEAVRRLVDDPETRERIATAGHARFRRDYSESALAGLLHAHLQDLLGGEAPSRRTGDP